MRVRITEPEDVPDLLAFLESRIDCVATQVTEDEIEVSLLGSYDEAARRLELTRRLSDWKAKQLRERGARAEAVLSLR